MMKDYSRPYKTRPGTPSRHRTPVKPANMRTVVGHSPARRSKKGWRWLISALVVLNAAVFIYHGNPFNRAEANTLRERADTLSDVGASETALALAEPDLAHDTQEASSEASVHTPVIQRPKVASLYKVLKGLRLVLPQEKVLTTHVRSGDSLAGLLMREGGLSGPVADKAIAAIAKVFDVRRLMPGQSLRWVFTGEELYELKLRLSSRSDVRLWRSMQPQPQSQPPKVSAAIDLGANDTNLEEGHSPKGAWGDWIAERVDKPVDVRTEAVSGIIAQSLWQTLVVLQAEKPLLVHALVNVFAWDIDFYSDVQPGDRFRMLVEKEYVDGDWIGYGRLLAAEFVRGETTYEAYRFEHGDDNRVAQFYDRQGNSTEKQLLKAPVPYGHVTSGYGSRRHPVLGYTRQHNGIDYGVGTGTPVWSVGEGTVVRAGRAGGFGNLVEVRHANGWLSQYAHLSRILVKRGQRVHQKQIVGKSGSTGLSSGPHLHYGLKKSGRYVNPAKQDFERAPALKGEALKRYLKEVQSLAADLMKVSFEHSTDVYVAAH